MKPNCIYKTILYILSILSLSSCTEDRDKNNSGEYNNIATSTINISNSLQEFELYLNEEYEFGESINEDAAVTFSDDLKGKWFCLVGGPGAPDITFKNDYPYNLKTREYVFDDHLVSNNISFIMGIPGHWYLTAYVVKNDTIHAKTEGEICINYPPASTIISECSSEIENLWSETILAANKEGREEKGCWIYTSIHKGLVCYNFGDIESGPFVYYGENTNGDIEPSKLKETYPDDFDNLEKGEYAVGYIHAHTPLAPAGKCAELQRKTGPSNRDKKWADVRGIPLMTIDYSDSMIRSDDPIDSPTTVYVVGPSSRTINKE